MGSLTTDVAHFPADRFLVDESPSLPGEGADDPGNHSHASSARQPLTVGSGDRVRMTSVSSTGSYLDGLTTPDQVRRVAEKLDRLDQQAEQIRVCAESMLRWSMAVIEECSPNSPLLARVE